MPEKAFAVRVNRENPNDESVKLISWLVKEGQAVKAGQMVAEIETSKAIVEVSAPQDGHARLQHGVGEEIPIGEILFYLTSGPTDSLPEKTAAVKTDSTGSRFSQKAQALMEKNGLDPAIFGNKSLVRESDVLEVLAKNAPPGDSLGAPTRAEPLPRHKMTEIRYLSGGQNRELASSVSLLCETKGLRETARQRAEWGGSLTPVVIFETARLLRKYPVFNSFYQDGVAHYYQAVNIGFAVDAEKGLRVPVIMEADRKSVGDIARQMQDLALRYFEGSLDVKDISGGTFTITDLSAEGVFSFRPLINYRQCAILALGGEVRLPGAAGDVFELSLTFDHRLTEGRAAALFLRELKERLKTYENKNS